MRAAVDAVGKDVLAGRSLREALRDLLRRGPTGRGGLDDLEARARRMRREAMRRGDLDGAVTRAQQLLDQAIAAERDELSGRDDDDARFAESMLDNLPRSTARAVEELSDYQWASDEARGALPADPRRPPAGGGRAAVPRHEATRCPTRPRSRPPPR